MSHRKTLKWQSQRYITFHRIFFTSLLSICDEVCNLVIVSYLSLYVIDLCLLPRSCKKIPRKTCRSRNFGSKTAGPNTDYNPRCIKANWFSTINLLLFLFISLGMSFHQASNQQHKENRQLKTQTFVDDKLVHVQQPCLAFFK